MSTTPDALRMGDTVPGHVLIAEGRDANGNVYVHEVRSLDEPFLGLFFPENLYPNWRFRIETRDSWAVEKARTGEAVGHS